MENSCLRDGRKDNRRFQAIAVNRAWLPRHTRSGYLLPFHLFDLSLGAMGDVKDISPT